jgi:hypothetical protein
LQVADASTTPIAPRVATPTGSRPRFGAFVLAALMAVPAAATMFGLPYYVLDRAHRLRAPLHPLLKPSGTVGLAFGIAGFALFLFLWLYPLRKRARWLAWTGAVGRWLDVHIAAGLLTPFVVAVHAGWRFEGLIGLGYLSMAMVAASGIVGRYLYTHIPRSRAGVELSRDEVAAERRALLTEIAAASGLDPMAVESALSVVRRGPAPGGLFGTLRGLLADDLARRRALASLERRLRAAGRGDRRAVGRVLELARREMALDQQARMLEATRQVFGWWHVFHRPFALTALVAVTVHVVVAIALGAVAFG